jgi:hypothetical protein
MQQTHFLFKLKQVLRRETKTNETRNYILNSLCTGKINLENFSIWVLGVISIELLYTENADVQESVFENVKHFKSNNLNEHVVFNKETSTMLLTLVLMPIQLRYLDNFFEM